MDNVGLRRSSRLRATPNYNVNEILQLPDELKDEISENDSQAESTDVILERSGKRRQKTQKASNGALFNSFRGMIVSVFLNLAFLSTALHFYLLFLLTFT